MTPQSLAAVAILIFINQVLQGFPDVEMDRKILFDPRQLSAAPLNHSLEIRLDINSLIGLSKRDKVSFFEVSCTSQQGSIPNRVGHCTFPLCLSHFLMPFPVHQTPFEESQLASPLNSATATGDPPCFFRFSMFF